MTRRVVWVGVAIITIAFCLILLTNEKTTKEENGELTIAPELIIEDVNMKCIYTIDEVQIGISSVTVKNIGNTSFDSCALLEIVVNGVNKSDTACFHVNPKETSNIPHGWLNYLYIEVERFPGNYEFSGVLYIKNETTQEILAKKNFSVSIPIIKVGDTVLIREDDGDKFDLTINSWRIEPSRWDGDRIDVVINLTITNSYSRTEEEIPLLFGSLMTEEGFIVNYDKSTLKCPNWGDILPRENISCELRIGGMPKDWKPVEADLGCHWGDIEGILLLD